MHASSLRIPHWSGFVEAAMLRYSELTMLIFPRGSPLRNVAKMARCLLSTALLRVHYPMPFAAPRLSTTTWFLISLLLLLFVFQCGWFIQTQSLTNDEPEHIVAGVDAWRFSEFERWHDQPPLARLLFSLPMLNQSVTYTTSNGGIHPVAPAPPVWQYRTRWVNVLLGIAMMMLLWNTARRLFSESAANFVLALAVLSPDLIAHFSLATIDGAGTLFLFASVVQLMRWRSNPSTAQTLLLGVSLGCMLLSKFNSPPLFALTLFLVLVFTPEGLNWHPRAWHWRQSALALGIACAVVWSGYFFHVSRVTFANEMVTIHFAGYTHILQYEMPTLKTPLTIFIPACEWMTGLGLVIFHNIEGHRSFLLGHYSTTGFKLYFPVAMFFKWPLIVLLLSTAGVVVLFWRKLSARRELLWMSIFPAVYLAFAITAHIDIGVRHVLPLYPFLLLYAGCVWEIATGVKWARALFGLLLLAQAVDIARYAPDYLSYFNPLVRPEQTWQILSDSNTDGVRECWRCGSTRTNIPAGCCILLMWARSIPCGMACNMRS
jgi:hypothetical protein